MHLLEAYALQCGAKIDKSFIYESYFPMPVEKFITFQAQSKMDAKDYDYWQDVLNMIAPVLSKAGIHILQVGGRNEFGYQRTIDIRGQTNFHQLAYVLRRSLLHLGPDSLGVHIASHFDVPIVGLYSVSMKEVSGPHFGNQDKQIIFECYRRVGNKKASFAAQESPKSINSVKPEEVAAAVFKLLGIEFEIPIETVHVGSRYSFRVVRELIPNQPIMLPQPDAPVEIRYDLSPNDTILGHHLSYLKKAVILTDRAIRLDLLQRFKPNIATLVYRITENDDIDFVAKVVSLGINVILVSELSEEILAPKKIKFYEYGKIHPLPKPKPADVEELRKNVENLYFRSSKIIASGQHSFGSHAHVLADKHLQNDHEYIKVIDSPKFWDDLDFYTIVRKK